MVAKWRRWRFPQIRSWDIELPDSPRGAAMIEKLDDRAGFDVVMAVNPDNEDNYSTLEEAKRAALSVEIIE
jgi:hypothetical protein